MKRCGVKERFRHPQQVLTEGSREHLFLLWTKHPILNVSSRTRLVIDGTLHMTPGNGRKGGMTAISRRQLSRKRKVGNKEYGHDKNRGPSKVGQSQKPDEGHVTRTRGTSADYSEGDAPCPEMATVFRGVWLTAQLSPNFPPRDQPRGTIRPAWARSPRHSLSSEGSNSRPFSSFNPSFQVKVVASARTPSL